MLDRDVNRRLGCIAAVLYIKQPSELSNVADIQISWAATGVWFSNY